MKVAVVAERLEVVAADALLVGLWAGDGLRPAPAALERLGRSGRARVRRVVEAERFQARAGQVTHVHLDSRRVVLVGLGPRREAALDVIRRAAAAGVRRARDLGAASVATEVLGDGWPTAQRAQAVVEGAVLGTYAFDRYKREKPARAVTALTLAEPTARQARAAAAGARRGEVVARAVTLARDLVNAPANDLHPADLAAAAERLARERGLRLQVFDRDECRKLGMGAFLGVAQGSSAPPRFLHLAWVPSGRRRRRVALVGKGVTFDSGGLDLKSTEGMARMKYDMSGAAAVLGVLGALAQLRAPVEVHGLVAAAENMPSGSAIRPGDVLRAMNGTTIEIGNTDAEGRLTLADAICYARERVKPDEIIDVATLTGASVVALGPLCAALMANDRRLADRLQAAAERAGERVWPLPLIDEYREQFKSDVADLNNTGGRHGGAIIAGLFLREFAGDTPWAHLDIAGVAFTEKDLPLAPKGATGVAVRTLLAYLAG